jgi:hypothetical protein
MRIEFYAMSSAFSNGAFLFPSLNPKMKNKTKENLKEINKNTKLLHFLLPHFSELIKRIRFFLLYKNDVLRRRESKLLQPMFCF